MQYQGRELAARFWGATAFRPGRSARLVPTRANGQPAFGLYVRESPGTAALGNGILVLTIAGGQISAVTGFPGHSALRGCGLPAALPG
jgi:RNA polymerase sigma-70 factor (ECF subfamily)